MVRHLDGLPRGLPGRLRSACAAGLAGLALLTAGCGGEAGPTAPPLTSIVAPPAPEDESDPPPNALDLFDWAERHYGNFFPVRQSDQQFGAYTFRHYPQTGNYMGVAGSSVYILGPVAGGGPEPLYLGELRDFTCQVLLSTACVDGVPRFLHTPEDATVNAPASARFDAQADSPDVPALYQWQASRDGGYSFADLPGATGPSFDTGPTTRADDGLLLRVVGGAPGRQRVSNAARLTVLPRAQGSDAIGLSVGDAHACVVARSGRVACWGSNVSGQLGDGTRTPRSTAVPVAGLDDAVAVAAGDAHTCALRANGSVVCWGLNLSGQLGVGDAIDRLTPTPVPGLAGITRLHAFSVGTCAVAGSGAAYCWGAAAGDGGGPTLLATAVPLLDRLQGRVDGSGLMRCAALASFQVGCWGTGLDGQVRSTVTLVDGAPGMQLAAVGTSHACALGVTGGLFCWGRNDFGQLADGGTAARSTPSATPGATGLVDVMARRSRTCAVTRGNELLCWGDGLGGLLWPASTRGPVTLALGSPARAGLVGLGGDFLCQLSAGNGAVRCAGGNALGQLGSGGAAAGEVQGLGEL